MSLKAKNNRISLAPRQSHRLLGGVSRAQRRIL